MASYFEEPDHSGHQAGPDSDLVSMHLYHDYPALNDMDNVLYR